MLTQTEHMYLPHLKDAHVDYNLDRRKSQNFASGERALQAWKQKFGMNNFRYVLARIFQS